MANGNLLSTTVLLGQEQCTSYSSMFVHIHDWVSLRQCVCVCVCMGETESMVECQCRCAYVYNHACVCLYRCVYARVYSCVCEQYVTRFVKTWHVTRMRKSRNACFQYLRLKFAKVQFLSCTCRRSFLLTFAINMSYQGDLPSLYSCHTWSPLLRALEFLHTGYLRLLTF